MFLTKMKSESKKVEGQRSIFSPSPSPSPLSVLPATLVPYHISDSPTRTRPNPSAVNVKFPDPLQTHTPSTDQTHGMSRNC